MKKRTSLMLIKLFFLILACVAAYSLVIKPARAEVCWCDCVNNCSYFDGTRWVIGNCCSWRDCGAWPCWSGTGCVDESCQGCTSCGGGGGGTPDTEKPVCRVIVNPTITNVSIKNPSFEIPIWQKHEMNCPTDWYNRSDGGRHDDEDWCDYGLSVTKPGGYNPDGLQHVIASYPLYGGFQRISGIESFNSRTGGVLYRGSASGQGCPAFIGLRDDGRYGNIASVANTNTCGWSRGSLLGWDFDAFHLICRNCEEGDGAAFDLVTLEKLYGSTNVSSQIVNIFVAFDDNRNVEFLSHWNSGEPEPEISWTSTDPRVIAFGPGNPRADGIAHTLTGTGAGSRTINVRIMDRANNKSEICSATVGYTPPTGTITGNVYEDLAGGCDGNSPVSDTNWSVTCQGDGMVNPVPAEINVTTGKFTCCKDRISGCNDQLPYDPTLGTSYNISLTPPADYKRTSCSKWTDGVGGAIITSVLLKGTTKLTDSLYLWKGASAWFQTKEGDVHAQGGTISSPIYPDDEYFCSADDGNYPGVVSYLSGTPDFGSHETPSEIGWLAEDNLSLSYDYDYFYSKLGSPTVDNFSCDSGCPTPPTGTTVYYSADDVLIEGNNEWEIPANTKVIALINRDLNISLNQGRRITVPVGSFLAFIVKGDINIAGNVGSKTPGSFIGTGDDSNSAFLQGVYLADGVIDTYEGKDEDTQGLKSGFRFVGAGLFYAGGGFNLQRDLKTDCTGICNENTPAELFIARPDLFVNIPEALKTSYFFEQEVAP